MYKSPKSSLLSFLSRLHKSRHYTPVLARIYTQLRSGNNISIRQQSHIADMQLSRKLWGPDDSIKLPRIMRWLFTGYLAQTVSVPGAYISPLHIYGLQWQSTQAATYIHIHLKLSNHYHWFLSIFLILICFLILIYLSHALTLAPPLKWCVACSTLRAATCKALSQSWLVSSLVP